MGALRALLCGRDGRVAESQHVAQRRSMKNVIFNYRSKSASYVLSAPLLSHSASQMLIQYALLFNRTMQRLQTAQRISTVDVNELLAATGILKLWLFGLLSFI